jgi:hypothetical protein
MTVSPLEMSLPQAGGLLLDALVRLEGYRKFVRTGILQRARLTGPQTGLVSSTVAAPAL